jgi:hypothetical protein
MKTMKNMFNTKIYYSTQIILSSTRRKVDILGLFEKAGVILKPREEIVKRGVFRGKIPKGVKRSVWSGEPHLEWDYVREGELVLTNRRLIAIGMKPWSGIVVYPDLSFETFTAVREMDSSTFLLFLGGEEIMFEVHNASKWVKAIKAQCRKEEPEERAQKETKQKN